MHVKKMVAVLFAALLVTTAVGCGSSKKADNVSASGNAERQSDGGNATTTTTRASTSGTGSDSNSSGDGLGLTGDCIQASMAYGALYAASAGFASGASQEEIDKFDQQLADLKAKIPAELRDDFQTVSAAYQEYIGLLQGLDVSNPEGMAKLAQASEKMSTPEVTAAQERISAYFTAHCGN